MADGLKVLYVKNFVSKELCYFLTNVLLRQSVLEPGHKDTQVPTAKSVMDHEVVFETLQERMWPAMEELLGEELIPTYSYARLYSNGDDLKPHIDRPACEISATVQLGRSHQYAWPIYMGGRRVDMAEGDAVIYKGCEIEHWRNVCDGPEEYYSGQAFLHYVRANGPYASEHGCDITIRPLIKNMYVKNRTILMDTK
jgi:hypothetical protein